MRKEIRVCVCGCIHFVDQNIIHDAIEHDKNTLLICGQCGRAYVIGADRVPNWYKEKAEDPDECFDMYSYEARTKNGLLILDVNSFNKERNYKPFDKVIYDKGHVVIMQTGYRATYFHYETGFEDMSYPDFTYRIGDDTTKADIVEMIEDYHKKRKTVMMSSLIHCLTDEENALLAKAKIKGLDYSGTDWERL